MPGVKRFPLSTREKHHNFLKKGPSLVLKGLNDFFLIKFLTAFKENIDICARIIDTFHNHKCFIRDLVFVLEFMAKF